MTYAHFLYIPFVLAVGFALGWHLGSSSVQSEWDRAESRRKARDEGRD